MNSKPLFRTLLLLLMLGKGFSFAQPLMHYVSEEYGYSIQVPEDFKRADELQNPKLSLVMLSPEKASISVAFYPMKDPDQETFIQKYLESSFSKMEEAVLQERGQVKSRDKLVNYLLYDYQKNGEVKTDKAVFYFREKDVAILTASQIKEEFHLSLPDFDKIIKSFTFETDQSKVEGLD